MQGPWMKMARDREGRRERQGAYRQQWAEGGC